MNWVIGILVSAGLFFLMVGSLGIIRMPDFFSRAHAVGKADTLASMLILSGLAIHNGLELTSLKLLLILGFVALANPAAVHALTRAGLRSGLVPWMYEERHDEDEEADWPPVTPRSPFPEAEEQL